MATVTNLILGAKSKAKKGVDKNTKNPNSKYKPMMLAVPVLGPTLDAKKHGFGFKSGTEKHTQNKTPGICV